MEIISNAGREKDREGANSDTVSCLCKEEALPPGSMKLFIGQNIW